MLLANLVVTTIEANGLHSDQFFCYYFMGCDFIAYLVRCKDLIAYLVLFVVMIV